MLVITNSIQPVKRARELEYYYYKLYYTIDNFNLPAQKISKLWDEQDKYIDLLETKLRKASQQDPLMKSKLLNKNWTEVC